MKYGDGHQTLAATTPDQLPVLVNGLLGGRAVVKDALCHASLRYKQEGKKKHCGVCQSAVSRFMLGENAAPCARREAKGGLE